MTDIKIKWSSGEMVVCVESFLSCRSIAKVRKLFRILNKVQPCTPDPEEVEKELCDYIKKKLSTVNSTYCKLITRYEEYQKQIPVKTWVLNELVAGRSRYKKSSEEYKMYSEQIKKNAGRSENAETEGTIYLAGSKKFGTEQKVLLYSTGRIWTGW